MNKAILITIGAIVAIILIFVATFVSVNNRAIFLEEQVKSATASIEVQEKRRVDLIINLVDTVKSYNKFESETMAKIVEARSKASNGDVGAAQLAINAVVEAYPILKSQENYKTLMTELALTENMIKDVRNNYNDQVNLYKRYIRTFPNKMYLGIMGYEKINTEYTEYNASADSPKDLFKE